MNTTDRDASCIWHPYTQMQTAPEHIAIARAQGTRLYAEDGREFIDAVSSWWVNIHGHTNPYIAEAISAQASELEQVIFAGFTHKNAVSLAENLLPLLPGEHVRLFYSDNGSTAVEAAMKMALQYFSNKQIPKKKFIALEGAYHGDTFGAMSASERGLFTDPFRSLLFDVERIPLPQKGFEDESISAMLRATEQEDTCAFIFEPLVLGASGMLMYEPEALDQLISIARASGALIIADEVMTGFGRTGPLFATELCTEKPDIICLSKGITGGFLPLGATSCTKKIYEAFLSEEKEKMFFHGHSYTANPLACAAACASLEISTSEACVNARNNINRMHLEFAERLNSRNDVSNVRVRGTILAFDVQTKEETTYTNSIRDYLYQEALSRGVLLRPLGNILYFLPPYCITEEELIKVQNVASEILDTL